MTGKCCLLNCNAWILPPLRPHQRTRKLLLSGRLAPPFALTASSCRPATVLRPSCKSSLKDQATIRLQAWCVCKGGGSAATSPAAAAGGAPLQGAYSAGSTATSSCGSPCGSARAGWYGRKRCSVGALGTALTRRHCLGWAHGPATLPLTCCDRWVSARCGVRRGYHTSSSTE